MPERILPIRGVADLATADVLEAQVMVIAAETRDDIVLDCSDLEFIDSVGIAAFVRIQRTLRAQARRLRIVNLSDRVRRPFDLLGLTDVLGIDVYDAAN